MAEKQFDTGKEIIFYEVMPTNRYVASWVADRNSLDFYFSKITTNKIYEDKKGRYFKKKNLKIYI